MLWFAYDHTIATVHSSYLCATPEVSLYNVLSNSLSPGQNKSSLCRITDILRAIKTTADKARAEEKSTSQSGLPLVLPHTTSKAETEV